MALTSPAVHQSNVMQSAKVLIHEWINFWFDGGTHMLGESSLSFPQVSVAFDQGPPAQQPMANPEIRLISRSGRVESRWYAGRKWNTQMLTGQFYIKAPIVPEDSGSGHAVANLVGDRLFAVLNNAAARYDLAAKGVRVVMVRAPEVHASMDYPTRLVLASLQLTYIEG